MTNIMALFDLDGTLSHGHIWEWFLKYYLSKKQKRAWILAFWVSHLFLWLLSKGKIISEEVYRTKWIEDLGGIFKGASREEIMDIFHWVANNYVVSSLRSDVVEILHQHKQSGHTVVIVSGTYSELLEIVGQVLDVPNVIGTRLEVVDDKYTGKIVNPSCIGENKVKLFEEFINQNGVEVDLLSSFAYADSIFDVPLLKLVGNPVATYPDEDLRQLAEHNGWRILP